MAPKNSTIRLTDARILSNQLAIAKKGECPYTLLLGAGASASSGIPVSKELVDAWKREIFSSIFKYGSIFDTIKKSREFDDWEKNKYKSFKENIERDLDSKSDYGVLFQYTRKTRSERQMYIEHILEGKTPGPGYFFLAGLMMDQRINRILTTNFDDMLEDALRRYYDGKPIVCGFDSAVNSVNLGSIRPKIIKLHGDFLFDNIKNTDEELVDLGDNMEKKLIEMCEDRGLIAIGYSGNDDSVMVPIYENLRKNKKFLTKGLHWCIHRSMLPDNIGSDESEISADLLPQKLRELAERFPKKVFFYRTDGFDSFFEDAFDGLQLRLPKSITAPLEKNRALDFLNACGTLQRLYGRIPRGLSEHRTKTLNFINDAKPGNELIMTNANHYWNEASIHKQDGKFDEAIICLEKSLSLAKDVEKTSDYASPIWIDSIARQLGCYIDMAKIYHKVDGEWGESLSNAKKLSEKLEITEVDIGNNDQTERYIFAAYNVICTIGLDVQFNLRDATTEAERIQSLLNLFKCHSFGSSQLAKLMTDSDIGSIKNIVFPKE